jgi:hypothetical protein
MQHGRGLRQRGVLRQRLASTNLFGWCPQSGRSEHGLRGTPLGNRALEGPRLERLSTSGHFIRGRCVLAAGQPMIAGRVQPGVQWPRWTDSSVVLGKVSRQPSGPLREMASTEAVGSFTDISTDAWDRLPRTTAKDAGIIPALSARELLGKYRRYPTLTRPRSQIEAASHVLQVRRGVQPRRDPL